VVEVTGYRPSSLTGEHVKGQRNCFEGKKEERKKERSRVGSDEKSRDWALLVLELGIDESWR
jgi:hypothetical protein